MSASLPAYSRAVSMSSMPSAMAAWMAASPSGDVGVSIAPSPSSATDGPERPSARRRSVPII